MAIARSKTRDQYPLSDKKIIKKTLGSVIGAIILFVVFFGIIFVLFLLPGNSPDGSGLRGILGIAMIALVVLLLLSIILTYFYQRWYIDVYFYDLTDEYIVIRKGPITPHEITVPYARVQDVYVDQDLLDRFFGLYDVHISSATVSSGWLAHIDGVEKIAADGLRNSILETVSKKINRPAPQVPAPIPSQ